MLTSAQLAAFCEKVYAAGWVYWYGTYGKPCTASLYESKKKQYPEHYTSSRASGYRKDIAAGKWCADCVGMIKAFFWTGGDFQTTPVYKSHNCPDVSANGMIKLCAQTGKIGTMPDIPGLVVWKDGHIGVYIGDGCTIEMRGFAYDCVKRKVKDGPWTKWGRLPASMISYDEGTGNREQATGGDVGTSSGADAPPSPTGEGTGAPEPEKRTVEITGGSVNVRSAPGTEGTRILGVVHKGDALPYQGMTKRLDRDWYLIAYQNQNAWVSSLWSRLA